MDLAFQQTKYWGLLFLHIGNTVCKFLPDHRLSKFIILYTLLVSYSRVFNLPSFTLIGCFILVATSTRNVRCPKKSLIGIKNPYSGYLTRINKRLPNYLIIPYFQYARIATLNTLFAGKLP